MRQSLPERTEKASNTTLRLESFLTRLVGLARGCLAAVGLGLPRLRFGEDVVKFS